MPPRKKKTAIEDASAEILSSPEEKATIEAYQHSTDHRVDIPTQENSHLVASEAPKKTRYAYDPSLDPQLTWAGKAEKVSLDVDAVPIFIQEKIAPQHIINGMKALAEDTASQIPLFSSQAKRDFLNPQYYQHESSWTNRMILGDSLLAMNSLLEKENLRGRVQCIYIDPPYGIKFGSNWQTSTKKRDVKDKEEDLTRQPEQIKAFRDTWELGIHSYLGYLRDRLITSRELLTESGSCFVQISDENVHLVRCLMDEVFGSENFVSLITYKKTTGNRSVFIDNINDYLLWYAKDTNLMKFRRIYDTKKSLDDENRKFYVDNDENKKFDRKTI